MESAPLPQDADSHLGQTEKMEDLWLRRKIPNLYKFYVTGWLLDRTKHTAAIPTLEMFGHFLRNSGEPSSHELESFCRVGMKTWWPGCWLARFFSNQE